MVGTFHASDDDERIVGVNTIEVVEKSMDPCDASKIFQKKTEKARCYVRFLMTGTSHVPL